MKREALSFSLFFFFLRPVLLLPGLSKDSMSLSQMRQQRPDSVGVNGPSSLSFVELYQVMPAALSMYLITQPNFMVAALVHRYEIQALPMFNSGLWETSGSFDCSSLPA